ncbi:MAG: transketolase, partial [bacterium]|nr:transketolase [bacterium]
HHLEFMEANKKPLATAYGEWNEKLEAYAKAFPEEYKTLSSYLDFQLPGALKETLLNYRCKPNATRGISGEMLNICAEAIPQVVGGCADLVGSTKATVKSSSYIQKDDFSGRNIAFGVREHAMGAIGNGLALNRSLIPFTSTFFTFFDYMKPAVRLAALMKLNHLFIFSHDSIYVGEDGPTHQPIEHLNSLRLLPDMTTFRPANDFETAFSFLYFFDKMNGPAAVITTRQKIAPAMFENSTDRTELYEQFCKGGYVFYETEGTDQPDIVLCGSGSEVSMALETGRLLEERDKMKVRVVSIPCVELLSRGDAEYKESLLGSESTPLVLVEAASHRGVDLFYGRRVISADMSTFGASAPAGKLAEFFGFSAEAIYKKVKKSSVPG